MAFKKDQLLDLSKSTLIIEGTPTEQDEWADKVKKWREALLPDKNDRRQIYVKRRDFYTGNQGDYSNIVGVIKDIKNKKGHVNQIVNYAGKTAVKIAYGLANNPPQITIPALDPTDPSEVAKAQAVQNDIDRVLSDPKNSFWKKAYRRCVFNQVVLGDAAFRVFPDVENKRVTIFTHDDMGSISVGWNGYDPDDFDCVIAEMFITPQKIMELYGIKVNESLIPEAKKDETSTGSWEQNNQWASLSTPNRSTNALPSGKNKLSKLKVTECDTVNSYGIMIEDEVVEYIVKDDAKFPKMKLWTIIHNIPNPPSNWSIADIDYLIDPQIEINDNDNRTADYLRVGGVQRYVAYNMQDFDPESIKTSSGQVIFVNDPDGKSKFEPLQTNINNFPSDQYSTRKMAQMYDMGLPRVNYGATNGMSSGRSKAIDFQSSVDLTTYKRDSWELALQDLIGKIQILEHFLHPELDWFNDQQGEFVVRAAEFDWAEAVPTTHSDLIVNVANKVNMIGIPYEQAFKELGYRDPGAMIETLKKELKDPDLMLLRSKAWQFSPGLVQAQEDAAQSQQQSQMDAQGGQPDQSVPPPGNQAPPTLVSSQNSGAQPMASSVGATSSPAGMIAKVRQNQVAGGR